MINFNVQEIRDKLNNEEYLLGLVKKMHSNNENNLYDYPEEWSSLMISINEIWNKAKSNGEMIPFSIDDFKLFFNGTIATIFKENAKKASNNTFAKFYECDKLSNLAWLPTEIAVLVFSQNDLIDAILDGNNFIVSYICNTANSEVVTVLNSKFIEYGLILENDCSFLRRLLNKYYNDLEELKITRTNKNISREEFIPNAKSLSKIIREINNDIKLLSIKKNKCMQYALYSSSISASKVSKKVLVEYNNILIKTNNR